MDKDELMKLIDDYAEKAARSYWQDDQGHDGRVVEGARKAKATARARIVRALEGENEDCP